jgi:hypothetical protein
MVGPVRHVFSFSSCLLQFRYAATGALGKIFQLPVPVPLFSIFFSALYLDWLTVGPIQFIMHQIKLFNF